MQAWLVRKYLAGEPQNDDADFEGHEINILIWKFIDKILVVMSVPSEGGWEGEGVGGLRPLKPHENLFQCLWNSCTELAIHILYIRQNVTSKCGHVDCVDLENCVRPLRLKCPHGHSSIPMRKMFSNKESLVEKGVVALATCGWTPWMDHEELPREAKSTTPGISRALYL